MVQLQRRYNIFTILEVRDKQLQVFMEQLIINLNGIQCVTKTYKFFS